MVDGGTLLASGWMAGAWAPAGGCVMQRRLLTTRYAWMLLLAAVTLSGCASGNHMAPVDEASTRGGVPSATPAAVASAAVSKPYDPAVPRRTSQGVQVRTIPYGGEPAAAKPLTDGGTGTAAQGVVAAPVDTNVALLAPAAVARAAPAPPPATLSPAVAALVNDADARAGAGQHDQAAASLERALKVEPSNAWLWHRLAGERLAQGRLGEAESLAGRSNSLAAGDDRLIAGNWRLIEQARRRRGDGSGADDAARRASGLETG